MRFLELRPRQFRNLAPGSVFAPDARFNVVTGRNAQGKTNLLEAIYLCATLKPLRAGKLTDLVRWGDAEAAVAVSAEVEGVRRDYQVAVSGGRRSAKIDGKVVGRPADYLRRAVRVIAFIPDDLEVAKGSAGARRRFLDRAVYGYEPSYLVELRAYNRCLQRRAALLRVPRVAQIDRDVLEAFDRELADLGARVVARRIEFLDAVAPLAAAVHAAIAAGNPAAPAFAYEASGHAEGVRPTAESLRALLEERLPRDHALGATTVGPHRDDLGLLLDGQPLRRMASQGQQRSVILALKIAEIALARERHQSAPVLLLDDVAGELDRARAAALFDHLRAFPDGQVLVTTTDRERVPLGRPEGVREWVVEGGVVQPADPA